MVYLVIKVPQNNYITSIKEICIQDISPRISGCHFALPTLMPTVKF